MNLLPYSDEVYKTVERKLNSERQKHEKEACLRRESFFATNERAAHIYNEISELALHGARAVLSGDNSLLLRLREKREKLSKELTKILSDSDLRADFLEAKCNCRICSDSGLVFGNVCVCVRELLKKESMRRLEAAFEEGGLSAKCVSFGDFSLDYYSDELVPGKRVTQREIMKYIFDFCWNYAKNFNLESRGLLLVGETGLGKTHISLSIAKEVLKKGYSAVYVSAPNMISVLEREKFGKLNLGKSESNFIKCDLLIIDDLGAEFPSSFSSASVYNILNSRVMRMAPTIISTNFSMYELEKLYGARVISRIIGYNTRLEFVGTDIRQKKVEKEHF
ncbi:MAG: ATP-binding protein [Oscillospiraceae bacterium]|jgi:DNA replication protein DnaC|nr:ATP-binding protein [Oscillospiraceae bacterium]